MAADNDMQVHRATYDKMIGWFKTGSIIVAVVAAFVIFLITRT